MSRIWLVHWLGNRGEKVDKIIASTLNFFAKSIVQDILLKRGVETHSFYMKFSNKVISNVTYSEESCANSLIIYENGLVLVLPRK